MIDNSKPNGQRESESSALARVLDELMAGKDSPSESASGGGRGMDPSTAERRCPEPGRFFRMASGQTPSAETEELLAHAAGCAQCAARMRESLRPLDAEASPEEAAAVAEMESASADWQHSFAAQLARTPRQSLGMKTPRIYLWAGAGLAASLALAAGLGLLWRQAHTPERLIAEAYGQYRSFDLRVPGAGFAAVNPTAHLRGGSTGRESAKLLDARARIERQLESSPDDPHWLQLQARADVLEEKFDPAIDILDRLLAAGPVTPGLLVDDASAYFQRGVATESENDRATALEALRRADEMAPGDPMVLFNEAIVMEDRGQVMNAVETWNRYLRFERDEKWLDEGRRRLQALEKKLNQIRTHQSRIERHLTTPEGMRALAADEAGLAKLDEELANTLLPRLLNSAFPLPPDRSRGSPCNDSCLASRTMLHALASSLERNHQDPWLSQLLPSDSAPPRQEFFQAVHALGLAIDADAKGEFSSAQESSAQASRLFHQIGNAAGEDRAAVERVYALQRSFTFARCQSAAEALLGHRSEFAWIRIHASTLEAGCGLGPGVASASSPLLEKAVLLAEQHHYLNLELRARTEMASAALESGDSETTWRIETDALRRFYAADLPPFRGATIVAGLAYLEESTPRVHLALLLSRETLGLFEMSPNRAMVSLERKALIRAAIRAGSLKEAQEQISLAGKEEGAASGHGEEKGAQAESEIRMAGLFLDRGELAEAGQMLDRAEANLAGEDNFVFLREFAVERGELELALGEPEKAEPILRRAILKEELEARGAGQENIIFARKNRDLYAALAGVWLAEHRSGPEILALWERYRLRILGLPVSACPEEGLACLRPRLERALQAAGGRGDFELFGQIVLRDRLLLYRADGKGIAWSQAPTRRDDLLAAGAVLERVVSSPATSQASIDQAARRFGSLLVGQLPDQGSVQGTVLLEADPILGNVPWPSVASAAGPIGLAFNLEESPSLLISTGAGGSRDAGSEPLVVGASIGGGESQLLPEALDEARSVAQFSHGANLLVAGQATASQVVLRLSTATTIHFAGHASELDGATRLLLAPSGALGEKAYLDSEVLRRHPPRAARLAVFSACSSGKREQGWNHGMGDIVDTLASLGVPDVVATRWHIDSSAAVPLMDAFYGGLAKGLSVPRALTAARLSLIRDARYRHPYYWAAYYAAGTGQNDLNEVFHGSS